ncbi:MAG: thiol reductase thioredoxin, partial [Planctomycetota bacterium]
FYSTYCEPCKRLSPIVDELANEYEGKLKVAKYNIDDGPEIAARFGIMGVPAVFFFKNGEVVERLSGFKPKQTLKEAIEKVLNS